jgi:hypothetical protein
MPGLATPLSRLKAGRSAPLAPLGGLAWTAGRAEGRFGPWLPPSRRGARQEGARFGPIWPSASLRPLTIERMLGLRLETPDPG